MVKCMVARKFSIRFISEEGNCLLHRIILICRLFTALVLLKMSKLNFELFSFVCTLTMFFYLSIYWIAKFASVDKSKDFIDDATMEHVRHNLFQLSSIEGMVTGGPPSAITFHSTVVGRRMDDCGKVNYLLRWEPEDILPDSWIPETEILSNVEKVIPVSRLPPQALQLPSLGALNKAGILPRPGKRKRK